MRRDRVRKKTGPGTKLQLEITGYKGGGALTCKAKGKKILYDYFIIAPQVHIRGAQIWGRAAVKERFNKTFMHTGGGAGVITAWSKQAKITVERKIKRNKERKDTQDRLSVVGLNAARRLS